MANRNYKVQLSRRRQYDQKGKKHPVGMRNFLKFADRCALASKFVYNRTLASGVRSSSRNVLIRTFRSEGLPEWWKQEKIPSVVYNTACENLANAWKFCYNDPKVEKPAFKKRKRLKKAFSYYCDHRQKWMRGEGSERMIKVPNFGWVPVYDVPRHVNNEDLIKVTFKCENMRWRATLHFDIAYCDVPRVRGNSIVGIDMGGEKQHIATHDGHKFLLPDVIRLMERKAEAQRAKAEAFKRKDWKEHARLGRKISRLWGQINRKRDDYRHKVTSALSESQVVVLEELEVKEMQSKKGDAKAARSSLQQAGIASTVALLIEKAERKRNVVLLVDPRNTSRTCPSCGHVAAGNRPNRETFKCVDCGFSGHSDVVAATNVRDKSRHVFSPLCTVEGLDSKVTELLERSFVSRVSACGTNWKAKSGA